MLIGIGCFLVFLAMAALMYTRRLSALLALPLMALLISVIGGIPGPEISSIVISEGALRLHTAYTTTMFGAVLAELINKEGIAKSLIRWVAEFAGDNPFILGILLTSVTALLFTTLGGLGAVIMVGTIVLPVMLSLGISSLTAGGLFLFGISLGGMFNLANWQLYMTVLGIQQAEIVSFVLPFAGIIATIVLIFLAIELGKLRNAAYVVAAVLLLAAAFSFMYMQPEQVGTSRAAQGVDPVSMALFGFTTVALLAYAGYRHLNNITTLPGTAMLSPFIPLVLVLAFRWDIIPAFIAGIAYGALITWKRNSINSLTRSILDGINTVIPAVVLMIGIGMLLAAVMHPRIAEAMAPLLTSLIPTTAVSYVAVFTVIAPLALYRGPLSLWGMGSGLVGLVLKTTTLSAKGIMGMLMSVGQLQGVCDPTNTHNIWIANYLGTDTQALLRRTIPYTWFMVFSGLCLAVAFGYVPW